MELCLAHRLRILALIRNKSKELGYSSCSEGISPGELAYICEFYHSGRLMGSLEDVFLILLRL